MYNAHDVMREYYAGCLSHGEAMMQLLCSANSDTCKLNLLARIAKLLLEDEAMRAYEADGEWF
jgi:hypothetical protein